MIIIIIIFDAILLSLLFRLIIVLLSGRSNIWTIGIHLACEENKMIDRPHSYTAMITLELKHTSGDNKKLEYILRKYRDTTTLRRP